MNPQASAADIISHVGAMLVTAKQLQPNAQAVQQGVQSQQGQPQVQPQVQQQAHPQVVQPQVVQPQAQLFAQPAVQPQPNGHLQVPMVPGTMIPAVPFQSAGAAPGATPATPARTGWDAVTAELMAEDIDG